MCAGSFFSASQPVLPFLHNLHHAVTPFRPSPRHSQAHYRWKRFAVPSFLSLRLFTTRCSLIYSSRYCSPKKLSISRSQEQDRFRTPSFSNYTSYVYYMDRVNRMESTKTASFVFHDIEVGVSTCLGYYLLLHGGWEISSVWRSYIKKIDR